MKIYIAGPMTGYAELNFPAFNEAAAMWRRLGHVVVNPAEINPDPTVSHATNEPLYIEYLKEDIRQITRCDAIYMLPGWSASRGASIEYRTARDLLLDIRFARGAERKPAGLIRKLLRRFK